MVFTVMTQLDVKQSDALYTCKLDDAQFQGLATVPAEVEWFANILNPHTRALYQKTVHEFMAYLGIKAVEEFRVVTRAHGIAFRDALLADGKAPATVRAKLSALSSLYDYLCDKNAVAHNPITGIARPSEGSNEGKTPALGNIKAKMLLNAPDAHTLKGKRDRAILAVFLFHALRRGEVAALRVRDITERQGIKQFRVRGKRSKVRYVPISHFALPRLHDYMEMAGHGDDREGALFRPVKNNATKTLNKGLSAQALYSCVVMKYAKELGFDQDIDGFCVHSLRATAATNALEHDADIAKVQQWLGHANIATTRLYDKRGMKPEESPTFVVRY